MRTLFFKYRQVRTAFENSLNLHSILKEQLSRQKYHEYAQQSHIIGIDSKNDFIISLTTYNKRIYEVYLTIESLFHQTLKPKKIILWLAENEFNYENTPLILKKQQDRGLEIRFCTDIKSYKKLIPTLQLIPNTIVITVDDDYIYPFDFVENLIKIYQKYPACVCYYVGSKISFDKKGKINPYLKWEQSDEEYTPSILNFATGAGGVLYPPLCFYQDIMNESLFNRYAPNADDIWFKAMTLLNDVQYVKVPIECRFSDKFVFLKNTQDIALYHCNVEKNLNDTYIKKVFEKYNLYNKLNDKYIKLC